MKRLRILLAEDDEMIEKITSYYLKKCGHDVDVARNGSEALRKFSNEHYDLILMDIQMPEMDGLQAVKEIRRMEQDNQQKEHTTIIAITTNANKAECIEAGVDGYARKPFSLEEFNTLFYQHNLV
ncbi:MAG TPA: response regulator [Bacteroidales bacterium]|nr:response regulator [Bacteroidales bacterium]HPT02641.1 response regulator [Bacteroidales bacterium]